MFHILTGKYFSRAPKARHYFIGNTNDVMIFYGMQQFIQPIVIIDLHPTCSLHQRLINKSCYFIVMIMNDRFYVVDIFSIRYINKNHFEQKVMEGKCKDTPVTYTHCAKSISMISIIKGEYFIAFIIAFKFLFV